MEITCSSLLGPNTSGLSLAWSHSSRQLVVESERRNLGIFMQHLPPLQKQVADAPSCVRQGCVGEGLLCCSFPSQASVSNEAEVSRIICFTPVSPSVGFKLGQGKGLLFTGLPHTALRISEHGRIKSFLALHSSVGHTALGRNLRETQTYCR